MPFVVAFVPGVTPGKWERMWRERVRGTALELLPADQPASIAGLRDGSIHMALLRDVAADDEFHAIPLYRERPVVVAPKDHAIGALGPSEELELRDLDGENLLDGQDAATVELVAANVGVALMPQAVARAHSRRDVIARVVSDAPDTGISLVWPSRADSPEIQTFIGIVRGRTTNSSR